MRRFIILGAFHLGLFAGLFGSATIAPVNAQNAPKSADTGCVGDISGDVTGVAALDARTFITAGRREVRLAGLEVPPAESVAAGAGKSALDALVAGKTVTLKGLAGKPGGAEDRYGRVVAYGSIGETSLQQALLREGRAWVAARIGAKPCADMLFSAETEARNAGRGLWAEPELRPKSAANPDDIRANKGRYTLVEGVVLSVRDSSATTYLNFGRRFTRDFSVSIARRDARLFTAAGIAPKQLEGKRIRVRGIIEMRSGPIIEATRPEQIELIP